MKIGFIVIAAASIGLSGGIVMPAMASTGAPTEIGYVEGSLGVAALMEGRLGNAERILVAQNAEDARDPARLINLGIVYARSGRISEARTAFMAVGYAADERLILSDGREMSSRLVAREQLAALDRSTVAFR